MNPTLNITATERTKATVSGSSGAGRSVDFDCGVKITQTLNNMGVEFTLDAPQDMIIHSELQAMGREQRGKLAVTMLTTGMYLADGNTSAFSMNSALSSFLNSERWAWTKPPTQRAIPTPTIPSSSPSAS